MNSHLRGAGSVRVGYREKTGKHLLVWGLPVLTRSGHRPEWGSAPQQLYFRTIQVCPKDWLTLPPAGWRCGKPTKLGRPLAGL
jgi:hypothetical protein